MNIKDEALRITEIFYSLQGESTLVGMPTVFIRLTGCPLRCQYCDTAYAFSGGKKWTIEGILDEVKKHDPPCVCVTGGEPLAQPNCIPLLKILCDEGYTVSIETSGAMDVSEVDDRVIKIVDIKTPASLEESKNRYDNLALLTERDQVKFVICNREDYDFSKGIVEQYQLGGKCEVLFSPSYHEVQPADLARWILDDHLKVRMQLQLHKVLWGEKQGV